MTKTTVSPILQMIRRIADDHRTKNMADQDLLERIIAAPDDPAFSVLLRRHGPMVLDVCRNVAGNDADAEDAFQATFLILAQKAKSIRKLKSVGSWLYGVAYRTALKTRAACAKRQSHELRVARSNGRDATDDITWRETQLLIHAELAVFSERDRAPLVLCFLEGRTQDEAAKHLGVSKATLKKRLEHGRALLRLRLVRRGLGPTALVAASAWPAAQAAACVAPALVAGTVKAATALALGQTTAGLLSAHATYLLENGLKAMLVTKLKTASAMVIAFALLPAFGGWAIHTQSAMGTVAANEANVAKTEPVAQRAAPKVAPSGPTQPESQNTQTVSGRVLNSDGNPAAGAKLQLLASANKLLDLGTSAADGSFKISVPKNAKDQTLVARSDGVGVDFFRFGEGIPTDPIVLDLVKDNPIKGRVVNTEGKPVAGAKVFVSSISIHANNSLDTFFTAWKKQNPSRGGGVPAGINQVYANTAAFLGTTTDSDGRFVLHGTGAERIVTLRLSGAGIADDSVLVANRPGFDPKPYNDASRDNMPEAYKNFGLEKSLHAPELSIVAEAERVIRGVVKDINTGKPRVGVKVVLAYYNNSFVPVSLVATTDAQGHYEIHGSRKAESYTLQVHSDTDAGYLASQVKATDTPGYEPIIADILVKKGVIVTGRVINASTKEPMGGFAEVTPLADNPFVNDYPHFSRLGAAEWHHTKEDGVFRAVTIPGPVLLTGGSNWRLGPDGELWRHKYKPPVPDPKYPQYFDTEMPYFLAAYIYGGGIYPVQGPFCKVLDIKPGTAIVTQDIILEPTTALPVKIQDDTGRPLTGSWVTGMAPADHHRPIQIKTDTCAAYHLLPGELRLMVFYEPTKKLYGTLALNGDEKNPSSIKLGLPGTMHGRLVGEDGKPLVGVIVDISYRIRAAREIHEHVNNAKQVVTDAEGRFQIEEVIPGPKFSLWVTQGKRTFEPVLKMDDSTVQAGAVLDLGELKLKLKIEKEGD